MVTKCKKNFFQNSAIERMTQFQITVTVKCRVDD